MATSDAARRWRIVLGTLVGLAVGGVLIAVAFGSRTPQMGSDEETFRAVDALFTAITARDEKRLAACEQRLRDLRAAGKLSPDAAEALDAIIAKARGGAWESASERLYGFMRAQRREGAPAAAETRPRRGAK